jgi:uncharacterized phage protein gp47/JayE
MPFQRPTLTTISTRIRADFDAALGLLARARRNVLDVIGRVWAGAVHGVYGYGEYISKQILPDTADSTFLARHAGIWKITRKAATAASGFVTFQGAESVVFPSGVQMLIDDMEFQSTTSAAVANGSVTVAVVALKAGTVGNFSAASPVSLISPVGGILPDGVVASGGITGGADAETDASLLKRLLFRIQEPPCGGATHDYIAWAMERDKHGVEVTRAWCYPREMGEGTVTVRFMTDGVGNGIPSAQAVNDVDDHLQTVRPVTADVFVVAPVAVALTVQLVGLNPDTVSARAAIEAELADLIRREAEPGGTILVSHIREAISIAVGEYDHQLVYPVADVPHGLGEICVFGGVTWA